MVSVSHFIYDACHIFKEIQERENEAEKSRYKEFLAARCIQRWFRGWITRKHLTSLHNAATAIQRRWRGYWQRKLYLLQLQEAVKEMETSHYALMATRIQKVWRGHYVRSRRFSFAELKKWLKNVSQKNEGILFQTQMYKETLQTSLLETLESESKEWMLFILFKLHHLIRTKHIPGIFSRYGSSHLSFIEKQLKLLTYKDYMDIVKQEHSMKNTEMAKKTKYELILPSRYRRCEQCWHERNNPRKDTHLFAQGPVVDSVHVQRLKDQESDWIKCLHDEPMLFPKITYEEYHNLQLDRSDYAILNPARTHMILAKRIVKDHVLSSGVKPCKCLGITLM